MSVGGHAALREAFDPGLVEKLPRLTCGKCRDAQDKVCGDHKKTRCADCGNYISTAHIHLDYVGHAAVTDRLLKVDPQWTWQPLAADEDGLPVVTNLGTMAGEPVGLWIELTVLGVTRPGFGHGKNLKEAIGDAIRNAAMRFGVALDLWSKADLIERAEGETGDVRDPGGLQPTPVPRSWAKVKELVPKEKYEMWEAFVKAASYHQFGQTDSKKLSADQRKVMLQKAAGAAVWCNDHPNTPLGATWSHEHMSKGWAAVLDGAVLETPGFPVEEPPFVDEEAERIADEVFDGGGYGDA